MSVANVSFNQAARNFISNDFGMRHYKMKKIASKLRKPTTKVVLVSSDWDESKSKGGNKKSCERMQIILTRALPEKKYISLSKLAEITGRSQENIRFHEKKPSFPKREKLSDVNAAGELIDNYKTKFYFLTEEIKEWIDATNKN